MAGDGAPRQAIDGDAATAFLRHLSRTNAIDEALEVVQTFLERAVGPCTVTRPGPRASQQEDALSLRAASGAVVALVRFEASTEGRPPIPEVVTVEASAVLERLAKIARLEGQVGAHERLLRQAGETIVRDAGELVRVLSELERRDAANKAELHHALRFQRAMLGAPPRHPAVACRAVHLAADVISGDLYDMSFQDDRLRVFLADVTGHGVAAGLATMFVKSEYEAHKRTADTPCALLAAMNDTLTSRYDNLALRFTALCLDIDVTSGRLVYASAAHPSPLVARAEGVEALPSGGPFVGLVGNVEFPEHDARLERGDVLLLYTDGLLDAVSPEGTPFGEGRVAELLAGARARGDDVCERLVRELAVFVGRGRVVDDVAILGIGLTETS